MAYKCVFSDIDGTLLNSKHQISEKTKKKVQIVSYIKYSFCPCFGKNAQRNALFLDELQQHL